MPKRSRVIDPTCGCVARLPEGNDDDEDSDGRRIMTDGPHKQRWSLANRRKLCNAHRVELLHLEMAELQRSLDVIRHVQQALSAEMQSITDRDGAPLP